MEGEAISATIQVLVQNLINVSKEEISLIRSLDENADTLRGTFAMIQSFLEDAQTKSITDAAVKTWLKELEAKVFDADNALDELNYQLLSKNVPSCFSSFDHYVHRRDLALRINQINTSFDSINKRAMELGLQQKLATAPAAASDAAPETDSFTVDPIFIGRDDDVLNIVEKLTTPTEEAVSILPIVGMGGLGKTTLARKVFNHEKTKAHFGLHIWVHVSRDFDAVALLKKILKNVKGGKIEDESREGLLKRPQEAENDEEVVLLKNKLKILEGGNVEDESKEVVMKKLQEALKGKTYLLVLDDDWNEEPLKWGEFKNSWSGITSTKGNGIIVTTRNAGVGSLVKTLDMHMLNGLSEDQCWSIIKERAFEGGPVSPDLEDIGKRIAERCRGLPLAANVVGGVLRGKSQDEWRLIEENWVSDVGGDDNDISRILKFSFHNLPSPSLKKCFAYCSIFPKGSRIDMQQLIELWMAEGFLQPSHQTSDMETIGNQYLKVLLQNSLLQVVDRNKYGDVEHCSMHDIVHDVAASILDDNYYKRHESSRNPKEQAKWYICWGSNADESSRIPKAEAKCLRTLIYNGRISDLVFSDFKSLHSLTLTDDHVRELPDSISELIHLRCLDISDTSIRYLPNSIGKLYHLQTIRHLGSGWYSRLRKLPSTLKNLFNLRHLYLADHGTVLPPEMGKLTYLQTLPFFKVRDKKGHRIEELGSLENLKGELEIYNLEKVRGEEGSKKACLIQKSGVVRLVLKWGGGRKGKTHDDENVLKGLQPHPNIKMLGIRGFKGACFPAWCLKMEGLCNLMEIRLQYCSSCEEIPTLGHLPHLKSLFLNHLDKVKSIGASFYGIDECSSNIGVRKETISVFPALERLELWGMSNLREWEEVKIPSGAQVKVFPCLEYLSIQLCDQLRSAPSEFTRLKELSVEGMESELPLASICGIKLKTLTKLYIGGIKGLISLPEWLFHNNQHLSVLSIEHCPKLSDLPEGMHGLNSLEDLYFWGCDNLRPVNGGKLQSLTSLCRLSIFGCPGVTNFLGEMGEEESWAPLLEDLRIDADGWDSVSSFNKAVDGILRSLSHSLHELTLEGMENWESLPDGIQHLTSLSRLILKEFGIKELPEWFGDLTSLQKLHVIDCRKLKCMPSVEAMRRLTKLSMLEIWGCPLLQKRCRQKNDEDSEWPKISHIPTVSID